MTGLRRDLALARRYPWAVVLTVVLAAGLGACVPAAADGGWGSATSAAWLSACAVWVAVLAVAARGEQR